MTDIREHDVVVVEVAVVADVVGESRRVTVPRETPGTVVLVMCKPMIDEACLVEFVIDNTTALATVPARQITRSTRVNQK